MNDNAVVECVPNFSEGRDKKKIDAIADAIRGAAGVKLLDVDPGADTNRTVYTFVGAPRAVLEAALAGARAAREVIDMAAHSGAHPRIGALDVCPFVPVSGISIEECAQLAREFGERLASELQVPVYLYEKAATSPARVSLADIRSGEYEGLEAKLRDPAWKPDFGPASFDARWGATVAGAREFLIAYNVNLNTRDKKLANDIALSIREGGRLAKNPDGSQALDASGNPLRLAGRLKAVRAIGWYIEQYRCAQVSINLLDYGATPLWEVFETVREEADKRGLFVTGSELVGLIPLKALADCGRHFLGKMGKSPALPDAELVEVAKRTLSLESVGQFDAGRKIVEWAYAGSGRLVSMTVAGFADEVSNDTPAPGGGSVAALAGSLGAALAAMVGNLTFGKKGYEAHYEALAAMAAEAQRVKGELMAAVDEDTDAFDAVLAASRLPKATAEQRAARDAAMLDAGKMAAAVPMATARTCLEAMKCCAVAVDRGNRNSVTDGAAGALIAKAGLDAALLNVRINLASLGDADFAARLRAESAALAASAEVLAASIKASADAAIGG